MSTPSPASLPALTFGGYAPEPGRIEGVSFWPRVIARLIDLAAHYCATMVAGFSFGIIIASAALLTHASIQPALAKVQSEKVLPFIAALLGATVYEIVCEAGHGSTLGKLMLGMTVVQEDGRFCSRRSAIIRSFSYYIDSLVFGLVGYLEMKKTASEQRHGDGWAKTVVCKRSKLRPDQLRSGGRFAGILALALMADAATFMTALTLSVLI